jgi:hypothetical protein
MTSLASSSLFALSRESDIEGKKDDNDKPRFIVMFYGICKKKDNEKPKFIIIFYGMYKERREK